MALDTVSHWKQLREGHSTFSETEVAVRFLQTAFLFTLEVVHTG